MTTINVKELIATRTLANPLTKWKKFINWLFRRPYEELYNFDIEAIISETIPLLNNVILSNDHEKFIITYQDMRFIKLKNLTPIRILDLTHFITLYSTYSEK